MGLFLLLIVHSATATAANAGHIPINMADSLALQRGPINQLGNAAISDLLRTTTLTTTVNDFFVPGTQPNQLVHEIPASTNCASCHSNPIYRRWRGSMMSQSARDPVMRAALAVANSDASDAGDYCLRCHVPKGWLEGRSTPSDGSSFTAVDLQEGVTCEICHRLVDPVASDAGETASLDRAIRSQLAISGTLPSPDYQASAMMIVDPEDNRRGPFDLDTNPHLAPTKTYQSAYLDQTSDAVTRARLCATCHNVVNPAMSWMQNPPGGGPAQFWPNQLDQPAPSFARGELFPIESTFEEWLNSEYMQGVYAPQFAGAKADGMISACQDCHMPRTTGRAAITYPPAQDRDCVTNGCLPEHELVGGNTWIPQLLQDLRWRLNSIVDAQPLDETVLRARAMLQKAATLTVTAGFSGTMRIATVRVTNESGHKLPTGYPEGRRMWLNLRAFNSAGDLIYESGAYDEQTAVLDKDPAIKVYEAKLGITPELAPFVDLPAGESFHFVLNNTYIKDNRIPPRGYTVAAFDRPGLRPVGATYVDGQFWDETGYVIPNTTGSLVATLYYQTSSKEYVDFLRTNGGADGQTLGQLWDDLKSPPELMAQVEINLEPSSFATYLPAIAN